MSSLLSRFAENAYWMARYVERAENVARILDVNETFARDSSGTSDWLPVLQLNSDEERFFKRHKRASANEVLHFYVADAANPTSVVSAVRMARENARSIRHIVSTEMWVQLNVFHNRLMRLKRTDYMPGNLSRACDAIKEACQTHAGVVEGTLYRDQALRFAYLGRYLERADQSSRLIDIAYRRVLSRSDDGIGPIDSGEWNSVLRLASGYHAFRRTHPGDTTPQNVAAFLMFDRRFPRSMAACVQGVDFNLKRLHSEFGLRISPPLRAILRELSAHVRRRAASRLFDDADLHGSMDEFQKTLISCDTRLGIDYFGQEAGEG
ncbi:MAG: alpha-E domain-containing protein [Acetobacterales bacterium]